MLSLRVVREGKDKGQGVGYLPDGTMVVVNNGQPHIGQQVEVQVQSLLQTGAGVIVFADLRPDGHRLETDRPHERTLIYANDHCLHRLQPGGSATDSLPP